MQNTLLAQRYAKALFELAVELNKLEEVKKDMDLLMDTIAESNEFRQFLVSPVIRADKKVAVLSGIFLDKVDSITMKFFELLAKNRREPNLLIIAEEFIVIYKKHKNITTVTVKTAVSISDRLKKDILERLARYTGGTIDLVEIVDEKLIGGFIVSIENEQYDASLLRTFNRLMKEFEENPYISAI